MRKSVLRIIRLGVSAWLLATSVALAAAAPPDNAVRRARQQMQAGDLPAALATLDALLADDPSVIEAHFTRGVILDAQQDRPAALAAFGAALRLEPTHAAAHYGRGLVHLKLQQPRLAIVDFSRALSAQPDADALNNRGLAWHRLGFDSLAHADFRSAMRLSEKYRSAYAMRPWAVRLEHLPETAGDELDAEFAPDATPNAEAYFVRALVRQRLGKNAEALADLQETLKLDPAHAAAWNWRGVLHDTLDEPQAAIGAFTRAVKLRPAYAEAYYGRGLVYLKQQAFADAERDFTQALRYAPRDADAYNNRGIALAKLDRKAESIGELRRAMLLDEAYAERYRDRPWAPHPEVGDPLTREEYDAAIERDGDELRNYLGRGYAAIVVNSDYDAAIADLNFVIERDPQHALALNYRAIAHDLGGRADAALADFDRSLALDPYAAHARYGRGLLRLKRGDLRGAVDDLTAAIGWMPDDADAWNNRAIAWHKLQRPRLAEADFRQAMRLSAQYAELYRAKPWAVRESHSRMTIEQIDELLAADPDDLQAIYGRAVLAMESESYDAALSDLDRVIALDSHHATAYYYRGIVYDTRNESAKATADFDRAIELDPYAAKGYYGRGLMRLRGGELDLAEADFSRAIELCPHDADALNNRGITRHKLGKKPQAAADFRRAMALAPRFAAAYRARDWAEEEVELDDAALISCGFLATYPEHADGLAERARQYMRAGNFRAALADCEAALQLDEAHLAAHQLTAEAWLKLGERERAIGALSIAITHRLSEPSLHYARGKLWLAEGERDWAERDFRGVLALDGQHAAARQQLQLLSRDAP